MVKVFFSYSHSDETDRNELEKHLAIHYETRFILQRRNLWASFSGQTALTRSAEKEGQPPLLGRLRRLAKQHEPRLMPQVTYHGTGLRLQKESRRCQGYGAAKHRRPKHERERKC